VQIKWEAQRAVRKPEQRGGYQNKEECRKSEKPRELWESQNSDGVREQGKARSQETARTSKVRLGCRTAKKQNNRNDVREQQVMENSGIWKPG
jgi:hypothetical protein